MHKTPASMISHKGPRSLRVSRMPEGCKSWSRSEAHTPLHIVDRQTARDPPRQPPGLLGAFLTARLASKYLRHQYYGGIRLVARLLGSAGKGFDRYDASGLPLAVVER